MPIITDNEINAIAEFKSRSIHQYHTIIIEIIPTGIGSKKTIRCKECKSKKEDITDYDSW